MCSNNNNPEIRLRNEFTAFIETTLKHAKIDYIRIYLRRKTREVLYGSLPEPETTDGDFVMAHILEQFRHRLLDEAFDSLPKARQKILACFFVHQMTAKEIAAIYGYSERYVYKLKYSSVQMLREYIAKGTGGESNE